MTITSPNGLEDVIRESGAGRVVNGNASAIAEGILALLEPTANAAASKAGRTLVQEQFRMHKVADRLETIYERALTGSRSRRAKVE